MKKGYEFIDHTADIGIKAYGDTIAETFEEAANAMFDIITDSSPIAVNGEYDILLSAESIEQLLVDWLSELLFLHDAYRLVFRFFQVHIDIKKLTLHARIGGEIFDKKKHHQGNEIKAVTYHLLKVEINKPCYVQVLFDI